MKLSFRAYYVDSRKVRRYRVTVKNIRESLEPYNSYRLNVASIASNAVSVRRSFAEVDGIIRGAINSLPSGPTVAASTASKLEPEYVSMESGAYYL